MGGSRADWREWNEKKQKQELMLVVRQELARIAGDSKGSLSSSSQALLLIFAQCC